MKNNFQSISYLQKRGFTLLEMIVSLGIFSVVAVIAVGSLVRISGLNRQAQTLQSSMNNISFALESMSRDMRMGGQYTCVNNIDDVAWANTSGTSLSKVKCDIVDAPIAGKVIAYESSKKYYEDGIYKCNLIYAFGFFSVSGSNPAKWLLKKYQQNACGDTASTEADFASIIDEKNITISNYQLGVFDGNNGYSKMFMRLKGYSGIKENERNDFDLQTAVSQRVAD